MGWFKKGMIVVGMLLSISSYAGGPSCTGHFVNPISDIAWSSLFPMTIGSVPVVPSGVGLPDTENPVSPVCGCPVAAPPYYRVGLTIGYWEPYALVDVTRKPYCMVNMGMELNLGGLDQEVGGRTTSHAGDFSDGRFYWVHWYKYPLIFFLQLMQSAACMQQDNFDLAYLTELDPTWDDDQTAFVINPEAILFGNPITQLSCMAESILTSTGNALPIDALFWCMGAQGSAYPMTGNTAYSYSPVSAGTLIAERMNFKLHREGVVQDTRGVDFAICYQYIEPVLPKSRYRYQMTNTIPDVIRAHPYTQMTNLWEAGHDNPVTGENFGFLMWKKRNCCFI